MKPFSLEAAKAGAPIITRDGREAKFIAHVSEAGDCYRFVWLDLNDLAIQASSINGRFTNGPDHINDLFMKPQKRTVWINLYPHLESKCGVTSVVYPERSKAIDAAVMQTTLVTAFPIEIEE